MKIIKGDLILKEDFKIDENLRVEGNIICKGGRWNIDARDINAWDINAKDINAGNIDARDINAWDISYYAVCFAYNSIECNSIKGGRKNCRHFVLGGKIKLKQPQTKTEKKNG